MSHALSAAGRWRTTANIVRPQKRSKPRFGKTRARLAGADAEVLRHVTGQDESEGCQESDDLGSGPHGASRRGTAQEIDNGVSDRAVSPDPKGGDFNKIKNEDAVLESMRANDAEPGAYMFPCAGSKMDMGLPQMAKFIFDGVVYDLLSAGTFGWPWPHHSFLPAFSKYSWASSAVILRTASIRIGSMGTSFWPVGTFLMASTTSMPATTWPKTA